jgi:non-homologous end joining protein Ku
MIKIKRIKNKKSTNMCSLNTHQNIRRENEDLEKSNNDELNHDIMTYYNDKIAKNKENNYEEDHLSDKYLNKISIINKQKNK